MSKELRFHQAFVRGEPVELVLNAPYMTVDESGWARGGRITEFARGLDSEFLALAGDQAFAAPARGVLWLAWLEEVFEAKGKEFSPRLTMVALDNEIYCVGGSEFGPVYGTEEIIDLNEAMQRIEAAKRNVLIVNAGALAASFETAFEIADLDGLKTYAFRPVWQELARNRIVSRVMARNGALAAVAVLAVLAGTVFWDSQELELIAVPTVLQAQGSPLASGQLRQLVQILDELDYFAAAGRLSAEYMNGSITVRGMMPPAAILQTLLADVALAGHTVTLDSTGWFVTAAVERIAAPTLRLEEGFEAALIRLLAAVERSDMSMMMSEPQSMGQQESVEILLRSERVPPFEYLAAALDGLPAVVSRSTINWVAPYDEARVEINLLLFGKSD